MNHREPTSAPPPGASTVLPSLALLLLPLLAVARAWCRPNLTLDVGLAPLKPYLAVLGTPPLRIEEKLPPPDLTTRPPASAPPLPGSSAPADPSMAAALAPDGSISPHPAVPEASGGPTPTDGNAASSDHAATPSAGSTSSDATSASVSAAAHTPPPILPDDTRPQVRPEDFLPYFQIPATRPGDPNVIVPVPRQVDGSLPVPPSSATYTQTPR